jgi:cytochrome c biogenesis protein CcdA
MKKSSLTLLLTTMLAGLFLSLAIGPAARAQNVVVRFYFFFQDCDDCQAITDELATQYGDQIEIYHLDISDPAVLESRLALEKWYGVMPQKADTPEVYVGDQALVGVEEIRARLPALINHYLTQDGAELPALPTAASDDPGRPVARFILFYGETCSACHNIMTNYLPTVYEKYGDQVESRYLEIWNDVGNHRAFRGLVLKLDVPQDKQGYVPTLVIGNKVLVGGDIPAQLEGYIDQYLAQGGVDYASLDDLPQPVEILVFFDPNHADSARLQEFIQPLIEQYGGWLRAYGADASSGEGAQMLAQFNAALGISEPLPGTPQVLIGQRMLVGVDEIKSRLPGLIETYKDQGGVGIPTLEELTGQSPAGTPPPATNVVEPAPKPIYLAYFEQAGCQECARTAYDLRLVQSEVPQLVVETFSIEENTALNEWLSQEYDVPEERHLATPMIFVGDDVLIGTEAELNNLMVTVAKYASTGAERTWDDFDATQAEQSLVDRFKSFGTLTVLGAGLIDGLNPCAFATLVFFISYLTFTGRRGRDVLFVGLSFALGVFLTYLLVGVGLLRVVQSLSFFTALGRWVYLVTALLCALLAILTFRDFFKARQGQVTEMTLALPMSLRRRIHQVIRESAQLRAFVAVAFFTGFVVSLLELACTGQVYLPTIMFVLSVPDMAAQAFVYLVLYCLMFILPLVIVFMLSYLGTTSEQLGRFVNRHTTTIKLLTGLVFLGLALWMTWTLAPLFGADAPWNWGLLGTAVAIVALGVIALQLFEKQSPPKTLAMAKPGTRRERRARHKKR